MIPLFPGQCISNDTPGTISLHSKVGVSKTIHLRRQFGRAGFGENANICGLRKCKELIKIKKLRPNLVLVRLRYTL
jgi:hypothetical protein